MGIEYPTSCHFRYAAGRAGRRTASYRCCRRPPPSSAAVLSAEAPPHEYDGRDAQRQPGAPATCLCLPARFSPLQVHHAWESGSFWKDGDPRLAAGLDPISAANPSHHHQNCFSLRARSDGRGKSGYYNSRLFNPCTAIRGMAGILHCYPGCTSTEEALGHSTAGTCHGGGRAYSNSGAGHTRRKMASIFIKISDSR